VKILSLMAVMALSFTVAMFLIAPEHVQAGGTPSLLESGVPMLNAKAQSARPKAPAAASRAPVAQPAPAQMSEEQAIFFVRSTLLTLDGANRTGNYSVLRDLASPEFQRRNTTADLALIFANLRRQGVDLGPAAMLTPQIALPITADAQGQVRIAGHLAAINPPVSFDLGFVPVDGHWRLIALAIQLAPVQQAAAPVR
jgi:hypothetical protein